MSHGEAGERDMNKVVGNGNEMRDKFETVKLKKIFNCDESGLI